MILSGITTSVSEAQLLNAPGYIFSSEAGRAILVNEQPENPFEAIAVTGLPFTVSGIVISPLAASLEAAFTVYAAPSFAGTKVSAG